MTAVPAPGLHRLTTTSGIAVTVARPDEERGPPVLFVHGIFAGAWTFEHWQRRFAKRGRAAYALDLRGRPGSRAVQDIGRVSLADYTSDVRDAAAMIGRPVLVGHSMGGLLAQAVAAEDRCAALVLLCSAPPRGIPLATPRLVVRQARHLWPMLASRPLSGSAEEHHALTLNRTDPATAADALARFIPDSGRAARELSLGTLRILPESVRCPTLVVVAGDDRFVAPRIGRALAKRYDATRLDYPNHAHFLVAEPGWERVADDVARWLDSLPD